MMLGDVRWVRIVSATSIDHSQWDHPLDRDSADRPHLVPHELAFNSAVLDEIRQCLREPAPQRPGTPLLAFALAAWGADAAAAISELSALLPSDPADSARPEGFPIAWALLRIGFADPLLVPHLRAIVNHHPDRIDEAHAIWRIAGDAQPLVRVLHPRLAHRSSWVGAAHHAAVTDAGPALRDLLPLANEDVTGAKGPTDPHSFSSILAARLVWTVTGNADPVCPTLRAALAGRSIGSWSAATLVADMAAAGVDIGDLKSLVGRLLRRRDVRFPIVESMWRLGHDRKKLASRLVYLLDLGVSDWHGPLDLLVRMRAVETVAKLRRLADRERRVVCAGSLYGLVWDDEAMRAGLQQAIASLREEPPNQ
jgi:hypothetical protein